VLLPNGIRPFVLGRSFGEEVASSWVRSQISNVAGRTSVNSLDEIKITPRDQQVLDLLVQGCSNKEIAKELNISARTVKQHLRTLFLRAGIREGRKRVKLATAVFARSASCNHANV
jgi:DNA-binding NarL/FixJ family response regulator